MDIEKLAIRTFEIDNHIIDCVNIYQQPAFKHPLLVNHTLQSKPNYPGEINDYISRASPPWNTSKNCPEGSIPIERMQRNGHLRGDLSVNHAYKHPHYFLKQRGMQQRNDPYTHEDRSIDVSHDKLYGLKATLNVWNPKVEKEYDDSISQVGIVGGHIQNTLQAGWMVHPQLYGTTETRFFTYWTDKTTKNWWLRLQGVDMGYWPKELFPVLLEGADIASFGGEVDYIREGAHTSTQMGSGHFAEEGFKKSSFIRNIQVLDTSNVYVNPRHIVPPDKGDSCYDIQIGTKSDGPWGQYLFFGGPGRSEKCT